MNGLKCAIASASLNLAHLSLQQLKARQCGVCPHQPIHAPASGGGPRQREHSKPEGPLSSPPKQKALSSTGTEGLRSGRRDWIRTNDPHHVKVVL